MKFREALINNDIRQQFEDIYSTWIDPNANFAWQDNRYLETTIQNAHEIFTLAYLHGQDSK